MTKFLDKWEKVVITYLSLAAPAVYGSYLLGFRKPSDYAIAAGLAIIGPIFRGMNPKDPAYGIVKVAADVLQSANPVKPTN